MPTAQALMQNLATAEDEVSALLFSYFHGKMATIATSLQAQAGLCLRCYVSAAILQACRTIDHLFGSDKAFTYRDLLPFVLTDDGKSVVILDRDRQTQLVIKGDELPQVSPYALFAVEVLRTFKAEGKPHLSLDNWAFLQTKQQPELRQFLAEFGFQHLSDWALLNRARSHQLEALSQFDRELVAVFHAVYRRDRRQQSRSLRRCPDPTSAQLQEMIMALPSSGRAIAPSEMMTALQRVASQLRQSDIWSQRVPLEVHDPETGRDTIRSDLPVSTVDATELEQQEILAFFQEQLNLALHTVTLQTLRDRVTALTRSKKYAPLAPQFLPGLQLYYEQGLSLKEIVPRLGMSSWDQARRVLNPGDLLSQVRTLTVQRVFEQLLAQAQQKGFAASPPEPDYVRTLAEQVAAIADQEIFQAAVEEMRAGQGRSLQSVYAQQLRVCLNDVQREFNHD